MREQRLWRDTSRFSLSAQMIVMVLMLSLVAMILVQTWAGIIATSVGNHLQMDVDVIYHL